MQAQQVPERWREWWEERVAIMKVDAGLERAQAEKAAVECLIQYLKELAKHRGQS